MSTVLNDFSDSEADRLAKDTVAVILAGGKGTRLGALTRKECKPALPFGGRYRNIDFSLSNCVNSGVRRIGVATQYKDASLIRHLERVWQDGAERDDRFVVPWRAGTVGYRGTAAAVFQNWARIESLNPELVLILAGDHVYQMDYRPMLERHVALRADLTVGCVEVPIEDASQFGVMSIGASDRVVRFAEKPARPQSLPGRPDRALGSMGIYVFSRDLLRRVLHEDARNEASGHDFGGDLIPRLIDTANVAAYPFTADARVGGGYWRDVGTVTSYWRAHMELLDGITGFRLDDSLWPIQPRRNTADAGLTYYTKAASRSGRIERSLLALGCSLDQATVHHSVLFEGVAIAPGVCLSNAVILPDAAIGRGCRLSDVVVEAGVRVPEGTVICAKRRRGGNAVPQLITADTDFTDHGVERLAQRDELTGHAPAGMRKRTGT